VHGIYKNIAVKFYKKVVKKHLHVPVHMIVDAFVLEITTVYTCYFVHKSVCAILHPTTNLHASKNAVCSRPTCID